MIPFQDPGADGELFAELREVGLVNPKAIGKIEDLLGRPETCTLNDFLLSGCGVIPERDWLSWLIRRHGCHRFGRVAWDPGMAVPAGLDADTEPNLPYRLAAGGCALVAVLRPDVADATRECLGPVRPLWAAATLSELGALRAAWSRRSRALAGEAAC